MIFSELYSAYYNTVAAILSAILDGEHSEQELQNPTDCVIIFLSEVLEGSS